MVEAPHDKHREGDEGRPERASNHVGRRRHFADVELDIANHTTKRADDGSDLDEIRVDISDLDLARLQCLGVPVSRDCYLEAGIFCQRILHSIFLFSFYYSGAMFAFSITLRHLTMSCAMRSRMASGVLPRASIPSLRALS